MMQSGTFNFETKDGLTLLGRVWQTKGDPKGVVNLVHGLGEHSGRYAHVAEALTKAGYNFIGFDLRGHGLSEGKRGHSPNYDSLMDDVALFLDQSRGFFGSDQPHFLYGHSLGGSIVINYGLRRKPELAGVIATGPALALSFEPPKAKLSLGRMLARLAPAFTMNNTLDVNALARDEAVVKAYQDDVLVHDRISAKLTMDLLDSGKYALEHAADWELPLLLMHGTEDQISSCEGSEAFASRGNGHVTLKLWDGYYHEIHNDLGKEKVIAAVIDWLNENS
jgi:alpha-beta hydrolase superfamily lysophospholipase